MEGIVITKMEKPMSTVDNGDGTTTYGFVPLFGFAVQDYQYKYDLEDDQLENLGIFGAILQHDDSLDDIINITKAISSNSNIHMIIYDIRNIGFEKFKRLTEKLRYLFSNSLDIKETDEPSEVGIDIPRPGYELMEDVYEFRIVYARRPEITKEESK